MGLCSSAHVQPPVCQRQAAPSLTLTRDNSISQLSSNSFKIVSRLGVGSISEVFLAETALEQGLVALKKVKKSRIKETDKISQAKKELKILKSVSSPFVVPLITSFQDEKALYYVLRFAEFGDLRSHLSSVQRVPEVVCRLVAAQIVLGLGALHGSGVIHCDLKPENVLVDREGRVMLTDFSHSQFVTSVESLNGTTDYMAPEVILNREKDYPLTASDYWALGVIIYELIVGVTPFYSRNKYRTFQRILEEEVQNSVFLSQEAFSLVNRLLVKDPSLRVGGPNWVKQLKADDFFKGIDWVALEKGNPTVLKSYFGSEKESTRHENIAKSMEELDSAKEGLAESPVGSFPTLSSFGILI